MARRKEAHDNTHLVRSDQEPRPVEAPDQRLRFGTRNFCAHSSRVWVANGLLVYVRRSRGKLGAFQRSPHTNGGGGGGGGRGGSHGNNTFNTCCGQALVLYFILGRQRASIRSRKRASRQTNYRQYSHRSLRRLSGFGWRAGGPCQAQRGLTLENKESVHK